jgi:hypothetical protein
MRIGMDTGTTSRIDGALAGIDYQYTWAFDASKQASVSEINGYDTFNATLVDDGINIDFSASITTPMVFEDADFTTGSVSSGSQIPDGVISGTKAASIGHPGRYFSTVATIHELTVADGTLSTELFGNICTVGSGGLIMNVITLGSDASHINGKPRSLVVVDADSSDLVMTQSEIDSLIGRPIAVTYDLNLANYTGTDDNPLQISLYPAYGENVTMNATIHGFIISNKPPRIYHLPVPINNPSI